MWITAAAWLLLSTGLQTAPAELAQAQMVSPVHYELDLRVDYEQQMLNGTARITVENLSRTSTREIPLTLYRLMRVSSIVTRDGLPIRYTQDIVQDVDYPKQQLNEIIITLPAALAPGERSTIEVAYAGYLLGYAETGKLYIKDHIDPGFTILRDDSHAFPIVGYASRAIRLERMPSYDYIARITVPDTLNVANGGRLVERKTASGSATFTYTSIKPSWRMDFAVGKYSELHAGPVRIVHLDRDSVGAARVARATGAALKLFEEWFGPVPGSPSLTLLEIEDGYGSQADITTILQTAAAFRDSSRNHEIYHEISHLWNVPDNDSPSPRWNEGLASFLEHLAAEKLDGGNVTAQMNAWLRWLRDKAGADKTWIETGMIDYGRAGTSGFSYSVGALFFDQLYRRVGERDFNRIIGGFAARFGEKGGTLQDLVKFADDNTKEDLQPLLTDWVLTPGWYAVIRSANSVEDVARHYAAGAPRN